MKLSIIAIISYLILLPLINGNPIVDKRSIGAYAESIGNYIFGNNSIK